MLSFGFIVRQQQLMQQHHQYPLQGNQVLYFLWSVLVARQLSVHHSNRTISRKATVCISARCGAVGVGQRGVGIYQITIVVLWRV